MQICLQKTLCMKLKWKRWIQISSEEKLRTLEVSSYIQASHFKLPAQHLCAPSCLTGQLQQPRPHLHGDVSKDLTCELHSAAILLPPPWSHHRTKQKVSTASACFPPALFSLPQTVWNAEKPELKPVEHEQLYSAPWLWCNNSCPWWLASPRTQPRDGETLHFPCPGGGWGSAEPAPALGVEWEGVWAGGDGSEAKTRPMLRKLRGLEQLTPSLKAAAGKLKRLVALKAVPDCKKSR